MQSSNIGFKMREKFMKNNGIFREIQMHRLFLTTPLEILENSVNEYLTKFSAFYEFFQVQLTF